MRGRNVTHVNPEKSERDLCRPCSWKEDGSHSGWLLTDVLDLSLWLSCEEKKGSYLMQFNQVLGWLSNIIFQGSLE